MSLQYEKGYEQIYRLDERRGVWVRRTVDPSSEVDLQLDICAGREGGDNSVTLRVGDQLTAQMLWELYEILSYARDAKAAFYPDRDDL